MAFPPPIHRSIAGSCCTSFSRTALSLSLITQCAVPGSVCCRLAEAAPFICSPSMTCQCCTCGHCVHPASFRPFHRPPSPPLPNNTLILPSTASAIDAPFHSTGRKRAHYDRDSNKTSPALLEALYWRRDDRDGGEDGRAAGKQHEQGKGSDGKEKKEKGSRPSSRHEPSSAASCRCPCHSASTAFAQQPVDSRPTSALASPRSPRHTHAPQTHSTLGTPRSLKASATKRLKADTTTATPRSTAAAYGARPVSGRSTSSGRQLRIHTPLNTDTAIFKGTNALSPIPTLHTPSTPHDAKYDEDDIAQQSEHDRQLNEQIEAARVEARIRSLQKKARDDALSAADEARRDKLEAAFQTAQAKRAQQVRADDAYYAAMLRRQYERRVKMDFFRQRFELHRREQRLAEGKEDERTAAGSGGLSRPAFVDFGGRNTRSTVDSERLLSFNIIPDLPPNAPSQPQSYNSARKAAMERVRQKQLVVKRVREELAEEGVEEAGDGQSEYDRKVAALAQRQRVQQQQQQQQQHHAQRLAAATHKPQRSSRPATAERSAASVGSSGSAYVPLLPLPVEPMTSASQSSYASFRPPSAQSVKVQRQRW